MLSQSRYTIKSPLKSQSYIKAHHQRNRLCKAATLFCSVFAVPLALALLAAFTVGAQDFLMLATGVGTYFLTASFGVFVARRLVSTNIGYQAFGDIRKLSDHSCRMLRDTAATFPATKQYIDTIEQHRALRLSDIVIVRHSIATLSRSQLEQTVA